jgi:hypothetical protein
MRLTIIPSDGLVSIDGVAFRGLDLSFFDPTYHAIQWNGSSGEIEIYDPETGKMVLNEPLTNIDAIYAQVYPLWKEAKDAAELLLNNTVANP